MSTINLKIFLSYSRVNNSCTEALTIENLHSKTSNINLLLSAWVLHNYTTCCIHKSTLGLIIITSVSAGFHRFPLVFTGFPLVSTGFPF